MLVSSSDLIGLGADGRAAYIAWCLDYNTEQINTFNFGACDACYELCGLVYKQQILISESVGYDFMHKQPTKEGLAPCILTDSKHKSK